MKATDADGVTRDYQGEFTEPVREVVGDDDKFHRVFTLEFTQTPESRESTGGEAWRFAFNQQENNRYVLEVSKRRGTAQFRRYDTVSTQREGTSFAINDSDYGERTCIISQGLGTMSVSYKGKSYWVCCSGCKAAFEDDPETWIARAEKRAAEEKK
jgi:ribosomal protein L24E